MRLLAKIQLKAERLKPAPDQRPAARYWQGHGWVYHIEVAVLEQHGTVLLETLVKPVCAVPAEVTAIHGLSNLDLANAPGWPAVAEQLAAVMCKRILVAHNASFDARMFQQSSLLHGMLAPAGERWECTMEFLTVANDGRWPRLGTAMSLAGSQLPQDFPGRPHRAGYDAACCRQILLALAKKHAQFFMSEQG